MKHDPIPFFLLNWSFTFCSIIQVNSMKQAPLRMITTEISLLNCLSDVALQYFRVLQGREKTSQCIGHRCWNFKPALNFSVEFVLWQHHNLLGVTKRVPVSKNNRLLFCGCASDLHLYESHCRDLLSASHLVSQRKCFLCILLSSSLEVWIGVIQ